MGGVPEAALIDRVTYQVQRQAIVATVNTALDVVVLGEDLDEALVSNLRTSAASVVGTVAAQSIGVAAFNRDIDRATQLIAHAALGCAKGAIGSGYCSSGAIGAFAGELTALIYTDVALKNPSLIGDSIERWKDNGCQRRRNNDAKLGALFGLFKRNPSRRILVQSPNFVDMSSGVPDGIPDKLYNEV